MEEIFITVLLLMALLGMVGAILIVTFTIKEVLKNIIPEKYIIKIKLKSDKIGGPIYELYQHNIVGSYYIRKLNLEFKEIFFLNFISSFTIYPVIFYKKKYAYDNEASIYVCSSSDEYIIDFYEKGKSIGEYYEEEKRKRDLKNMTDMLSDKKIENIIKYLNKEYNEKNIK